MVDTLAVIAPNRIVLPIAHYRMDLLPFEQRVAVRVVGPFAAVAP